MSVHKDEFRLLFNSLTKIRKKLMAADRQLFSPKRHSYLQDYSLPYLVQRIIHVSLYFHFALYIVTNTYVT